MSLRERMKSEARNMYYSWHQKYMQCMDSNRSFGDILAELISLPPDNIASRELMEQYKFLRSRGCDDEEIIYGLVCHAKMFMQEIVETDEWIS